MPITIPQTGTKSQKSVKLTETEWELLKKIRVNAHSDIAFALHFKLHRNTIIRICDYGSGSPANITQVRKVLKSSKNTANA